MDDRDRLLDELDALKLYPGVGFSGDTSMRVLRHIYAWLPAIDDAGYDVPRLRSWDVELDSEANDHFDDLTRSLDDQIRNASPAQIRQYVRWYDSHPPNRPLEGAEGRFVRDHRDARLRATESRRWEDVPYEELLSLAHAHRWSPERDAAQAELARRHGPQRTARSSTPRRRR